MKRGGKLYIDGFQQKIFDSLLLTCCLVDHNDETEIEASFPPFPSFFLHKAGTFFGPDLAAEERGLAASLGCLIFSEVIKWGPFWGDSIKQQIHG